MWLKTHFKRNLTGSNSEFFFFWISNHTKVKEATHANYLTIVGERIVEIITPRYMKNESSLVQGFLRR